MASYNSRLPQWEQTCFNQVLCFYQHLCSVDSEVLRNPPLRQAAKRWDAIRFWKVATLQLRCALAPFPYCVPTWWSLDQISTTADCVQQVVWRNLAPQKKFPIFKINFKSLTFFSELRQATTTLSVSLLDRQQTHKNIKTCWQNFH